MPQIKVLNNLLLAKLLKNFRWLFLFALIHELLNKSIICPRCLSLSLRYSIYKVQCLSLSRISFCILPHSISFVKNFFQVFSNFFEAFRLASLAQQPSYISTLAFICQAFFQEFSNFFPIRYLTGRPQATCIY